MMGLALWVTLAGAMPVQAAGELPPQGWKTVRVGVLPILSYAREPQDLFQEQPAARGARRDAGQWQRRLETMLGRLDQVVVVTGSQVQDRVARSAEYGDAVQLGAERLALGVEQYESLKREDALRHLDRAAELYRKVLADVVDPRGLADVALYRGLAHIELGAANLAHMDFREMLLLDPGRTFQPGYYPPAVEEALRGALLDVTSQADIIVSRHPIPRLGALTEQVAVDFWAVAIVAGSPAAPFLRLTFYDPRTGGVAFTEQLDLADPKRATLLAERALSAWHACSVQAADAPAVPPRPRLPEWYLDLGYTHTLMLKHDGTRDFYHSPGVQLGVSWEATSTVLIFFRSILMDSLPDDNGDLIDEFVTTRLALGAGLTGGSETVRFFVRAAVELAIVWSDIAMTRDVDCKHFTEGLKSPHPRCGSYTRLEAPRAFFGLDLEVGLRWRFADGWYLHLAGGVTSYVLEAELVRDLNFPLSLTLGLGNAF